MHQPSVMHSVDLFLHRPLLTACTTGYESKSKAGLIITRPKVHRRVDMAIIASWDYSGSNQVGHLFVHPTFGSPPSSPIIAFPHMPRIQCPHLTKRCRQALFSFHCACCMSLSLFLLLLSEHDHLSL